MRKARKKRRRLERKRIVKCLQEELNKEHKISEQCQQRVLFRKISVWERWQWELGQRKEAVRAGMMQQHRSSVGIQVQPSVQLQEIDHAMLTDPVSAATDMKLYLG